MMLTYKTDLEILLTYKMDASRATAIVNDITNLLKYATDETVKEILMRELGKYKVLQIPTAINFYGDIIPIPSDVVSVDDKLRYIRKLMRDYPELFTAKRSCRECKEVYNITEFGACKNGNKVYVRSYCHRCIARRINEHRNRNYIKVLND